MWQPYADVIQERAPQAVLVFDKFHIAQHLSRAVDQVRRVAGGAKFVTCCRSRSGTTGLYVCT
jgi:hypothetical protein